MAIEMELLLMSKSACVNLFDLTWKDLVSGMEKSGLRDLRPTRDAKLLRSFDVDCEAEILDWSDMFEINGDEATIVAIQNAYVEKKLSLEQACEGVLLLMRWASIGYWEAWEARAFLYFEILLDEPAIDIQELYEERIWEKIRHGLSNMTAKEYSESVVLDWMQRRKDLDESLDEKSDPRILPTMQAHTRLSESLHHVVQRWNSEEDVVGILGREHLSADKWGHGGWGLTSIIKSGLP